MPLNRSIIATSVVAALALSGCGGGSSNNAPQTSEQTSAKQGQFVDAAVEGLYYQAQPSGKSGLTDAQGHYAYEEGDTITFFLGGSEGLRIGSISARPIISPFEVTGNFQKALNLARILQSMDDPNDGAITLPESVKAPSPSMIAALNNVILTDIDSESGLKDELQLDEWKSEEEALQHLNTSLKDLESGSKTALSGWQKGSGKYLRSIEMPISAKNKNRNKKLYIHTDKLLDPEIFNKTHGTSSSTLRLDEQHLTELRGSNDNTISDGYAKLYLTCLKTQGVEAAFSFDTDSNVAKCNDTNQRSDGYDSQFELGGYYDYNLLNPTSTLEKDHPTAWDKLKDNGPLYQCLADKNCSESKLTGFSITQYDDSDKKDGSLMVKDHLSTSYDSVTGVYTQITKRASLSGVHEGRKSESLSFTYLVDGPSAERYVDFVGEWQAAETRPGCADIAKSTFVFDEQGVTVTGKEFSNHCETSEISESITYEELAAMDFWWFNTNGEGNDSKATLAQLNSTIRWCDKDEGNLSSECYDVKYNRWQYAPAGKDWDQGTLYRHTLRRDGSIKSYISMYKK
ncbi:hypothetical protein GTG28_13220 [Vibrio sp. OCN044]|uniref:Chromosome partitioning protein ParA n=1 Tax=Vibrio tetraodonis subsp. pristinus TaxID=2695891 RepID=A0A6L8M306_9VIBR|nr:hypothetical protein [Vibrio tetraodonis]MYM60189.1 hypothetical protein [Vibrio tetraodonis subsp. pristinus]